MSWDSTRSPQTQDRHATLIIQAVLQMRADRLRGMRRVGHLLSFVQGSPGARKTSVTRLQQICTAAGIIRQTAYIWKAFYRQVSDQQLESYIKDCRDRQSRPTAVGAVRWAQGGAA